MNWIEAAENKSQMVKKSLGLGAMDHASTDSVGAVAFFAWRWDRPQVGGLGHSSFSWQTV